MNLGEEICEEETDQIVLCGSHNPVQPDLTCSALAGVVGQEVQPCHHVMLQAHCPCPPVALTAEGTRQHSSSRLTKNKKTKDRFQTIPWSADDLGTSPDYLCNL
ncbi:hypothetical protein E2C01_034584 [Portunus trituberculatus]|uniref:Uncharacterized protein n=1 Tax=Portunus trituberculatus TaxID=210409 RepID=A0A5B7F943_PORTR|nr:hypothetical protein [Portunus trituberculatus]